ncbi:GGDEF domain-containing protein [Fertoeibacter niger]|nr:GGDEF domain-containing protein [Fertoeibacter niger]
MDGGAADNGVRMDRAVLNRLMPMHLCLSHAGLVLNCGPTLRKIFPVTRLSGRGFFTLFDIRRPGGITDMAALQDRAGERLYLSLRDQPQAGFRGIAAPLADDAGLLLNLSFGIGVLDAVRNYGLTDADFAATDLAVELLYLVEAKSAVMEELRQLNLRLQGAKTAAEQQALTDTLTGLGNRRALDRVLERAIAGAVPFGLMHVDLDFFKAVNDSLGHAAGDHVLREVARILSEETRSGDTVARVGGDEFVVVFPGLADASRLGAIARRMITRLNLPMVFEGKPCRVSASIGMTLSTHHDPALPDRMLAAADHALYAAKHAGRSCAVLAPQPGVQP